MIHKSNWFQHNCFETVHERGGNLLIQQYFYIQGDKAKEPADQGRVFSGPTNYKNYINTPGIQLNSINRGQGDLKHISVADLR